MATLAANFLALYLAGIAGVIYLNTTVLCLGDHKFDSGSGSWDLYFLFWVAAMAPAAVGVFLIAVVNIPSARHRRDLLAAGLALIVVWVAIVWHVSFLDHPVGLGLGIAIPCVTTFGLRSHLTRPSG